jgi:hypothetical protein
MRFRNLFLAGGSALTLGVLLFSDPNGGALTASTLIQLATAVIAVGFAHLARRALFDYLNLEVLYQKAKESATGAGLVFLGVCVVLFGLLGLFGGQVHAAELNPSTYVPKNATVYLPVLQSEKDRVWSDHPNPLT